LTRAALALALAALCSCAQLREKYSDLPGPERRSQPLPAVHELDEPAPAEGSLWRGETSRRFLAFEKRATLPGDLITVQIVETAKAESEAITELERQSQFSATLSSAVALQTLVTRPIRRLLHLLGFANQRGDSDPSATDALNIVNATTTSTFDGEGTVERESTLRTTVACLVTDVTPSGLLRIEGQRFITINRETQVIRLSGYVRPEDVQIDNTVNSSLVASAEIQYSGSGVVDDQQRVPWLNRIFGVILPF
jgi:flagellar L-ring protein precursor FlgH